MVDDRDTTPSTRDILHQKRPHKFCPYCGFRNEGDVDICDQCGKDISWIRIPEHTPTVSAPKQKPKSPPKKERIFSNLTIILVILGILMLIALILVLTLTTGGGEGETPSRLGDVICQVGAPSGPALVAAYSGEVARPIRSPPNLQPLRAL
ncbi:MAG: hypothetical protein KKE79_06525 [Actinobacteria bacterium]|nr:hypothetical protein [Actinomycetota bacterium]MBU4490275.1 hypothetical protein [Actinomycetota bacterium]MCG2795192.1 hypothetical protein [Actinomycetes bacterium]